VWRPASALQLTMNLFDLGCITGTDGDLACENYVQHVNECVSRDVYQFSQHGQLSGAKLKIAFCIRNPAARGEHTKVDEKHSRINKIEISQRSPSVPCQGH